VASAGVASRVVVTRVLDLRVGDPVRRPGPGLVQQAIRPALGEAAPPQRHCRPAHTDCLRDATAGAARLGAGQHDAGAGGQRLPRLPAAHLALQQAMISLGQHDRDRMRVGHGRASAADASNQQRNGAPAGRQKRQERQGRQEICASAR
jgi:hypothetical protein